MPMEGKQENDALKAAISTKSTLTYHAPFCIKPFGSTRLQVAGLLAGGFL